jgi:hypothetical protein
MLTCPGVAGGALGVRLAGADSRGAADLFAVIVLLPLRVDPWVDTEEPRAVQAARARSAEIAQARRILLRNVLGTALACRVYPPIRSIAQIEEHLRVQCPAVVHR